VGFGVVWNRDWEAMPQVVDDAPPAHRYFSAGFPTYAQLMYSGEHAVAPGKSETFSVEGDNAELRHYLDCGIIWTAALSGLRHYLDCGIIWRGWVGGAAASPAVSGP